MRRGPSGVVPVLPLVVPALPASLSDAVVRYLPATIGVVPPSTQPAAQVIGGPIFRTPGPGSPLGAQAVGTPALPPWVPVRRGVRPDRARRSAPVSGAT
ncbi:MAG TPA: hypothetical protein VMF60_03865, partial [Acidimicrobiales bacterium]|nr:hypothetical protein [Acidimicrobiales bacterium]